MQHKMDNVASTRKNIRTLNSNLKRKLARLVNEGPLDWDLLLDEGPEVFGMFSALPTKAELEAILARVAKQGRHHGLREGL